MESKGYNDKLSNYGRDRTLADNAAQSRRQANEVNTDSQVGRKQEWSRGIGAVPIIGPPADIIREASLASSHLHLTANTAQCPEHFTNVATTVRVLNTSTVQIKMRRSMRAT